MRHRTAWVALALTGSLLASCGDKETGERVRHDPSTPEGNLDAHADELNALADIVAKLEDEDAAIAAWPRIRAKFAKLDKLERIADGILRREKPAGEETREEIRTRLATRIRTMKEARVRVRHVYLEAPRDVQVTIYRLTAVQTRRQFWPLPRRPDAEIAAITCQDIHLKVYAWMALTKRGVPASLDEVAKPITRVDDEPFMEVETDPWGTVYSVERLGPREFRICSAGPDRERGSADDICYPE